MLAHRIPPHQLASMVIAGGTLSAPLYRSLAERIRLLAVDGRLPALAQLPSERDLATAMGFSRTTISTAYTRLREARVIGARRGAGHFITAHRPDVSALLPTGPCADGVIGMVAACMEAMPGTTAAFTAAMEHLPRLLAGPGYCPEGIPPLYRTAADVDLPRLSGADAVHGAGSAAAGPDRGQPGVGLHLAGQDLATRRPGARRADCLRV
ncbi:MAG: GntR family transcriptional regulator, partial [Antricoccus sp.]